MSIQTEIAAFPSTTERFVVATASNARRLHIFRDTALTSRSFNRSALCHGVIVSTIETDDTRTWDAAPLTIRIESREVTCDRCWAAYTRLVADRTRRGIGRP